MKETFEQLARSLAEAWRTCGTIPLPPAEAAPASRADAFAIQDRMAELIGDRCVGWKVGAAVRAVQILEGHDGPITGRLLASRMFEHPGNIPASLFDGYKIESEFAFRFRDAVPARARAWTRAEIAPLLAFHPGLEVAGTRYAAGTGGRKATTPTPARAAQTCSAPASPTGGASISSTCPSTPGSTAAQRSTRIMANSAATLWTSWSRPSTDCPHAASGSRPAISCPPGRSRCRRCCPSDRRTSRVSAS
jgi:2-keto-4-pentenoate hydratase